MIKSFKIEHYRNIIPKISNIANIEITVTGSFLYFFYIMALKWTLSS